MRNALRGAPSAAAQRYGATALALAVLPALAVANTGLNGLVLGLATLVAMALTSLMYSLMLNNSSSSRMMRSKKLRCQRGVPGILRR